MDYIWTPWRYQYMAQVNSGNQPECIFCDAVARNNDAETLIVHRGANAFVILLDESFSIMVNVGGLYGHGTA